MTQPRYTVPLTVYIRNGHMVDREEGGERFVIGEADIQGTTASMTLLNDVPSEILDAIQSSFDVPYFTIAFGPKNATLGFTPEEVAVVCRDPS